MCGFCNVWVCVCVGFVMCVCVGFVTCVCVCVGGFCNVWVFWYYVYCTLTEVLLTLTEVFPCFFLSCKANARVKLAKTGHGTHSSKLVVICVVLLFVFYCYLCCSMNCLCKCVLYYCPRVTTQLQLTNIIYLIIYIIYHIYRLSHHHLIDLISLYVLNHVCIFLYAWTYFVCEMIVSFYGRSNHTCSERVCLDRTGGRYCDGQDHLALGIEITSEHVRKERIYIDHETK